VPVDFVSTHGYADDTAENLFGTDEDIPMDDRVCRAIAKVRKQIQASSMPRLPLFWTEWNVQGMMESRDTTFVGPAVANTIRQCDGNVDMLSFWTFSDVFEEGGPFPKPFQGNFGLRAKGGINKPSFYAFGLLHQLGNQRLASNSKNVIVTRTPKGGLAIAIWNLVDPDQHGASQSATLALKGISPGAHATIQTVDDDHGNVLKAYAAMGKPLDPTPAQVEQLNRETALPAARPLEHKNGTLQLSLAPNTLALVIVE
jgi:xylan 1,4-beta-xylosidase